jgi:hypothetical protein
VNAEGAQLNQSVDTRSPRLSEAFSNPAPSGLL